MLQLLAIADLHTGSGWSPFPRGFQLSTGGIASLNKGQEYLSECLEHMISELPLTLDCTMFLGDMIDGKNRKEDGLGRTEPDPMRQAEAAAQIVEPIVARSEVVYCLSGSGYHTGVGGEHERYFAKLVGAEENAYGHPVYDWLLLNLGGVVIDAAHHQSYMMRYRSTSLEREMQFSDMLIPLLKDDTDLVLRAHVHSYSYLNIDGTLAVTVPPWKLPHPYTQTSRTPNRMVSKLMGACLFTIYPERKKPDVLNKEEFIKTKLLWYPTPRLNTTEFGGITWKSRDPSSLFKNWQEKSPKPSRP